jgi:hypothetical protein
MQCSIQFGEDYDAGGLAQNIHGNCYPPSGPGGALFPRCGERIKYFFFYFYSYICFQMPRVILVLKVGYLIMWEMYLAWRDTHAKIPLANWIRHLLLLSRMSPFSLFFSPPPSSLFSSLPSAFLPFPVISWNL